jgi:hypothetical protein
MIVIAVWISLSAGIVMGALWRSFCDQQSREGTNLGDSMEPRPLGILEWQEYVALRREHFERSMPLSPEDRVNRTIDETPVSGTDVWMRTS